MDYGARYLQHKAAYCSLINIDQIGGGQNLRCLRCLVRRSAKTL